MTQIIRIKNQSKIIQEVICDVLAVFDAPMASLSWALRHPWRRKRILAA